MPTLGPLGDRVRDWWRSLPRTPYLVLGGVLFAAAAWAQAHGDLRAAQAFCTQIVHDLGLIQPLGLIGIYFGDASSCSKWLAEGECVAFQASRFVDPAYGVGRLFSTVGTVWAESGVPGRVILPLALLGAVPLALAFVVWLFRKLFDVDDFNVFEVALTLVLLPFFASLLALGLQVLAIVIFAVFGAAFGLALWIGAVLDGARRLWLFFRKSIEWGRKAEEVVTGAAPVIAVPAAARPDEPD
jgi:hypothetical protein